MIRSGRYERTPRPKFRRLNLEEHDDQIELQRSVVKSESLVAPAVKSLLNFQPLYKHPLPISRHRYQHEVTLKRVMSTTVEKQAMAAVTSGDAWTLEEVCMRGASINVTDKSGYTPLHIAVQTNNIECIMVLINIGVDINAPTLAGITPLYLAKAASATQAETLLIENGARLNAPNLFWPPGTTILEYEAPASVPYFPPIGKPSALRINHKLF